MPPAHADDEVGVGHRGRGEQSAPVTVQVDSVRRHHLQDLGRHGTAGTEQTRRAKLHVTDLPVEVPGEKGSRHRGPADVGGADEEDLNAGECSGGARP